MRGYYEVSPEVKAKVALEEAAKRYSIFHLLGNVGELVDAEAVLLKAAVEYANTLSHYRRKQKAKP